MNDILERRATLSAKSQAQALALALKLFVNTPPPVIIPSILGPIVAWGDSMVAGFGSSSESTTWRSLLASDLGTTVYNGGIAGQTSSQVAARQLADTSHQNWFAIYWVGHNSANAAQTLADLQAMIAHQTSLNRYLILQPLIGAGSAVGSANYLEIEATRAAIIANFNAINIVDMPAALAANGNGSTDDNDAISNGYTPVSLRYDTLHLNDAGQAIVYATVRSAINALMAIYG
jgi:lysophospholipase L1-like esterase